MKKKAVKKKKADDLRKRAAKLLNAEKEVTKEILGTNAPELIHELEVHQIELEVQNEELRATQEALTESRNRYYDLYDFAPVGYFSLDKKGLILEVNLTGANLLGVERRALIKKKFSQFIMPDSQDLFYMHQKKVFNSNNMQSQELKMKKGTAAPFYVHLESIKSKDATGNFVFMRTVVIDITENKHLQEVLRESEELHRLTLSAISDAVFITDAGGVFTFISPNSDTIFGYSYNEVKALGTLSKLFGKGFSDDCKLMTKGEMKNVECDIMDKSGKKHSLLVNIKRVEIKGGTVLYTCHDVTERKEAQEELKKSYDELEQRVAERTVALQEANEQLRSLSAQLISSQESERKRVAQELHDSVGQTLSALKFRVENILRQSAENKAQEYFQSLKSLIPQIKESIIEINRIGRGLRPSMLDDLGVIAALSWFCREFALTYPDIRIQQKIAVEEDKIPENLKVVIYRVLQESLNNIAKHSSATLVGLSLKKTNKTLEFSIKDNGSGFDLKHALSQVGEQGGLGLAGMMKRIDFSGGVCNITSAEKTGTHIKALWQL